jgi:hypothetical protein
MPVDRFAAAAEPTVVVGMQAEATLIVRLSMMGAASGRG